MIYRVTINDKLYEVEVEEGKANLLRTQAVQAPPAVEAPAPAVEMPAPTADAKPAAASGALAAPMPGVVLEVKVAKGQRVRENELLLVLEAMKMENEIFAQKSGTVAEIYAAKGARVNTGDPLVLIV